MSENISSDDGHSKFSIEVQDGLSRELADPLEENGWKVYREKIWRSQNLGISPSSCLQHFIAVHEQIKLQSSLNMNSILGFIFRVHLTAVRRGSAAGECCAARTERLTDSAVSRGRVGSERGGSERDREPGAAMDCERKHFRRGLIGLILFMIFFCLNLKTYRLLCCK